LNFAGPVRLAALIEYIASRLEVKFLYSSELADREVTVHTPAEVPVASLYALLSSVLRGEGLAIVDADVPGWKRIVDARDMLPYAPAGEAPRVLQERGSASPVTQVFVLRNVAAQSFSTVIRPFLSQAGANVLAINETNVLVVTDYAPNVETVRKILELVDRPAGESSYEVYPVRFQPSGTLVEQVRAILGLQTAAPPGGAAAPSPGVQLFEDVVGNRIVIAGDRTLVTRAKALLAQLDVSAGTQFQVYRLRHLTAERLDKIVQGALAPQDAERAYQSTIDEEGNLLVVRTTPEIHRQIDGLIRELDVAGDAADSPIRFYKLKNASAIDVLYTLLALQEAYGIGGPATLGGLPLGGLTPLGTLGGLGLSTVPGLLPGQVQPFGLGGLGAATLGMQGRAEAEPLPTTRLPLTPGDEGAAADEFLPDQTNPLAMALPSSLGLGIGGAGGVATLPGGARVSADISTNSLIVVAPANVHPMYARLIESLDQRRPQVLIEAKIIAIDTTDNYALGVEVSAGDREGASRLFKFTSFGLSEVNPTTGALRVIPSLGFNGTLVDPDVADVVVQALASHTRAKVLAAPKILVNDNSTGKLESVVTVPFLSVNASETVSTTSLGGDQEAGTIITVTPHINEDDHLHLEFDVEFSTFTGTGTASLPPPRQIDRVGSTVTIPDGQTVIVGGLKRVGESNSFTGVPWAELIPIVRELTSLTDDDVETTSFFLFIRPKILRDTRFGDLRFLSERETSRAGISGEYPASRPVPIP
jgi:type II secretory pathway component GspD/PulD (secretin)